MVAFLLRQLRKGMPVASTHRWFVVTAGALPMLLALSACGREADDDASGGLTVGESDALERAADRIDARTPSPAREESRKLEADVRSRLEQEQAERVGNCAAQKGADCD